MEPVNRYSLRLTILLSFSFLIAFCSSAVSAVSTDYLDTNLNDDGSIAQDDAPVLSEQSTLQSLLTYKFLDQLDNSTAVTALAALNKPNADTSTELMSYWIMLNQGDPAYPEALALLVSRQNNNGGFGHLNDFASDPLNSAYAILALQESGYTDSAAANAIFYLLGEQNTLGAWNLVERESDLETLELTAIVSHSLWKYRQQYAVIDAVDNGLNYLQSQRVDDLWLSTEASALALYAIVNRAVDRSSLTSIVDAFSNLQNVNGSFDNDVYTTALALRVLGVYNQDPEDISVIRGQVIDAEFGTPITNASIEINGPDVLSLQADSEGFFTSESLNAGTYTIAISQDGFSRIEYTATLSEGTKADLGDVKLSRVEVDPVTGDPVTTGFIHGVVKDKSTGQPISGALISIAPNLTAQTNASGEYSLAGIESGQVTVQISAKNYQTVEGIANVGERQTVIFSPSLTEIEDPEVRISGVITDRISLLPIAGVTVSVIFDGQTFTATTDAAGNYALGDLLVGDLQITTDAEGYHSVLATATTSQGNKLTFSPALDLLSAEPEPQLAGIRGQIVDATSGVGLAEVAIQLDIEGQVLNIETDMDGFFEAVDLEPLDFLISLSKPLYIPADLTLTLTAGLLSDIGKIELLAEADVNSGAISGRTIDVRTNEALSNVMISLVNTANSQTLDVFSDENGVFSIAGVASEEYEITLKLPEYVDASFFLNVDVNQQLELGDIRLRKPGLEALLPDLTVRELDGSNLIFNQSSFEASGSIGVKIFNQGNAEISGNVEVVIFEDLDGDGLPSDADVIVADDAVNVGDLSVDQVVSFDIAINGPLSFYQAPLVILLDPNNLIAEISDANNFRSTASTCTGPSTGPSVDLALCMDASGSVDNNEFRLQQEGVAQALENVDIIPRDGSVRMSVYHFATGTDVVVEPTIIDQDTAPQIIDIVRSTRLFRGGTVIGTCIDRVSNDLVGLMPESILQVIDISTDGQSSGSPSIAATRAIELGIDVINGIAIGNGASISSMERWVQPQPAGGDRGFVVEAPSFEAYIQALADKIIRETKVVDLNIGGLRLIDNGASQLASASLVLGNSGAGSITENIIVTLYVGEEILEENKITELVFANGLVSGGSASITLDEIDSALVSGQKILAVAELTTGFAECDSANNRQIIEVSSLLGDVTLALDDIQYEPNMQVNLNGVITNMGSLVGDYTLQLLIQDATGNLVHEFSQQAVSNLASNDMFAYSDTWNTGVTPTGEYKAVAKLLSSDDEQLDIAEQGFTIGELSLSTLFTLNSSTDKQLYNVNDRAILEVVIQNLSLATQIDNAELQVVVFDPNGDAIYDELFDPAAMAPGQVLRFEDILALNQSPIGNYQLTATLKNSSGEQVVSSLSLFEVIDDPRAALTGSVTVDQVNIDAGDPQACNYTLTNQGLGDLADINWNQILVQVDDQQELDRIATTAALISNEATNTSQVITTSNLVPGGYACVLEAIIEDQPVVLASATFVIGEPDIQVSAAILPQNAPRLLALIDGIAGAEPGTVSSPDLSEQLTALENLLIDYSAAYTIVFDVDSFASELLTGNYNQFAILAENATLPDALANDLGVHIFLGDGLLVTSAALVDNPALQNLTGVQGAAISVASSELAISGSILSNTTQNIALADLLQPLHIVNADVEATFTAGQPWQFVNDGSCQAGNDVPAIAYKVIGAGSVITAGFDWLLHAANETAWQDLLLEGLVASAPGYQTEVIGDTFDVAIDVSSVTGANGQLTFGLPAGIALELTSPSSALWQQDGTTVTAEVALQVGERKVLNLPLIANTAVQVTVNGQLSVAGLAEQPLAVTLEVIEPSSLAVVNQALAAANLLYPRDPWVQLAQHTLSRATGDNATDLTLLYEAQAWLMLSDNNSLDEAKTSLARLIVRIRKTPAAN